MIGARPEALTKTHNIFGRNNVESKVHLDWSIERPKSMLATALLELVRICFKDLREPDFKEETYNQAEVLVSSLLENLDTPAMSKYN